MTALEQISKGLAKMCWNCEKVKLINEFYKNTGGKLGLREACIPCVLKRNREWLENNPDKKFKRSRAAILKKVNLTHEQYEQRVKDQNGGCAICSEKDEKLSLHVDHDHETNEVRGLLCKRCNSGIGLFRERLDLIKKAVEYLENHNKAMDLREIEAQLKLLKELK